MSSSKKLSKDAVIVNDLGLHARAAAKIAKLAQKATSTIWVKVGAEKADASSIMDILTLACEKGTRITLIIEDQSDLDILNAIIDLVDSGFGE